MYLNTTFYKPLLFFWHVIFQDGSICSDAQDMRPITSKSGKSCKLSEYMFWDLVSMFHVFGGGFFNVNVHPYFRKIPMLTNIFLKGVETTN